MGPQKTDFNFGTFWGKMDFAYYITKTWEFLRIRSIKTMGPKKRTRNEHISILEVFGQKCNLLITTPKPKNFLKSGLSKPWVLKKQILILGVLGAKWTLLITPPKLGNFFESESLKPWAPKKGPVMNTFQFWRFSGKNAIC